MANDKKVVATIVAPPHPSTAWACDGSFYPAGEHEVSQAHFDALKGIGAIQDDAKTSNLTAAQKAFNDDFGALADTFRELGFDTRAKLKAATEDDLRAIPGVDDAVIAKINK